MFEEFLVPATMGLVGLFSVEYAIFRSRKTIEKTKNELKVEMEGWLNSEKGQKAIYTVGVLLGNAIKQGVGLGKTGGKFKFEDLIGKAIAEFISSKIPIKQEVEQLYG